MNKKKLTKGGIVYSTDPEFLRETEMQQETLPPSKQNLKLRFETKHRGGKAVTILAGFEGSQQDLEILGKQLKTHCGTGGSVKNGEILIQGDNREKTRGWLKKNGYNVKG